MSAAGDMLLQAAATLRDTVYLKQVAGDPGLLQKITSISEVVIAVMVLLATAALAAAVLNFRKSYKKINELLDKLHAEIAPILRHATTISDNVDYISTSIRVDVQQVSKVIGAANRSLLNAVRKAEERIDDLNALLEVAQEEAESAFVATASTLRGVRTGINKAFVEEEGEDGNNSEAGDGNDEEPKPRVKRRFQAGRES